LTLALTVSAAHLPHPRQTNGGVHLAITPSCGKLGGTFANANAGIATSAIKTIVAFGDSYTSGGRDDGGPLSAAVLVPPNPRAGKRVTDGPVWVEDLAANLKNATLMDYADSGAVVDFTLWPSIANQDDFLHQSALFISQGHALTPSSTLYTVFFGINDVGASKTDGNHLPQAASEVIAQIQKLAASPTNGKNFLVLDNYGRGSQSTNGDAWKQAVFSGLSTLRSQGLNVAFVDFAPLWTAVLGTTPGFAAFGYTNPSSCLPNLSQTDLSGECSAPNTSFYWLPGHPSKETHSIMANYVELVLANCAA